MATRGIVPRANGEGSIGTEKKCWGAIFAEKVAVKALEVIGGGTDIDAQPATVGWVKGKFQDLLKNALNISGVVWDLSKEGESGYIYFGKLFGSLIIEFVYFNTNNSDNNNEQEKALPLALSKVFYGHVGVFSKEHQTLPTTIAGLTPDKGRIRVKFSVGKEKSSPVYGIIIGTI